MTLTQVQTHTRTARRATLGLLAALAVTLSTVAMPLAGAAHAGGLAGGVVAGGGSATGSSSVGTRPDVTAGTGPVVQPSSIKPGSGDF